MALHETIERDGRTGRLFQFFFRTVWLDIKTVLKQGNPLLRLTRPNFPSQCDQFINLQNLHMSAEGRALQGEIGVDIQHATVVMTHDAEPIVKHAGDHLRGGDPVIHFVPAIGVVLEGAGNRVKGNAGPSEDVRNFWNGTGATKGQPFPGHAQPITQPIERLVVDGSFGVELIYPAEK